jgi:hypothetical protein
MQMTKQKSYIIALVATVIGFAIFFSLKKTTDNEVVLRIEDKAPEITLTWLPEKPNSISDINAKLRIVDDHGIDFSSYLLTIVEAERTINYPVEPEPTGREWEQPLNFSLIAGDPKLANATKLTLRVEVADDRGQKSQIEKVIELAKK